MSADCPLFAAITSEANGSVSVVSALPRTDKCLLLYLHSQWLAISSD